MFWVDEPVSSSNSLPQSVDTHKLYRSKNGLKDLSMKVKEIVNCSGGLNYQEVTKLLISNLKQTGMAIPFKDEKNIRRRVYDALNIMIAAKLIAKEGKKVLPIGIVIEDPVEPLTEDSLYQKRKTIR